MKKSITILIIILFLSLGWWFGVRTDPVNGQNTSPQEKIEQVTLHTSSPSPQIHAIIASPKRLEIPSLDVNTTIESVGLDDERNMDVPKEDMNVAWYNLGYKVGERGNAVIAGHFDTRTGAPAVFYQLNTLKIGDEIIVSGVDGKKATFVVTGKETYPSAEFPVEIVFGSADVPQLNLITCDGVFDVTSRNYSQRTVVFTELKTS